MGITTDIYIEKSGEYAKKIHKRYNKIRHRLDDTAAGDVLNSFGIETDPFKEELE